MANKESDNVKKSTKGFIIRISLIIILLCGALLLSKFKQDKLNSKQPVLGQETSNQNGPSLNTIQTEARKLIDNTAKKTEETINEALGGAKNFVVETASVSAKAVSSFVFDNTVCNILKQVDKLPESQQEDIRRNICK